MVVSPQSRDGARFAQEALAENGSKQLRTQYLERHAPKQDHVLGQEDNAHATFAEDLQNAVTAADAAQFFIALGGREELPARRNPLHISLQRHVSVRMDRFRKVLAPLGGGVRAGWHRPGPLRR